MKFKKGDIVCPIGHPEYEYIVVGKSKRKGFIRITWTSPVDHITKSVYDTAQEELLERKN